MQFESSCKKLKLRLLQPFQYGRDIEEKDAILEYFIAKIRENRRFHPLRREKTGMLKFDFPFHIDSSCFMFRRIPRLPKLILHSRAVVMTDMPILSQFLCSLLTAGIGTQIA